MADVQPFRAVRFARLSDAVVAPPYDVVSRRRARGAARAVTRTTSATSPSPRTRTPRATCTATGSAPACSSVTSEPAVWVLEQDFVAPDGSPRQRRGIVASLRAEPYERGVVIPHERTHPEPIQSRLRLLRAARAQLEPLFFLYEGEPPLSPPDRPPDLRGRRDAVVAGRGRRELAGLLRRRGRC